MPSDEHPYSDVYQPYRNSDGDVVTVTPEQVKAFWHVHRLWKQLLHENGYADREPSFIDMDKSRAFGRLLIHGKPLFVDRPPRYLGAADYAAWDTPTAEPEQRSIGALLVMAEAGGYDDIAAGLRELIGNEPLIRLALSRASETEPDPAVAGQLAELAATVFHTEGTP